MPELSNLSNDSMENLFLVDIDEDGRYYYDLTDTIYVNTEGMNPTYFQNYVVKASDSLFGIAKKFYGTHRLWWIVAATNGFDDPFEFGESMTGKTIKLLKKPSVGQILTILAED